MKIDILTISDLNSTVQDQIFKLFQELGGDKTQIGLTEVLEEKNNITLAYCEDNNEIIGIALMCTYNVISGKKGWVEDVVVKSNSRGKGIGKRLMNKLIEEGKRKKLTEILLFTEDHRTSAINLYSDLGFMVKNSRIYNIKTK